MAKFPDPTKSYSGEPLSPGSAKEGQAPVAASIPSSPPTASEPVFTPRPAEIPKTPSQVASPSTPPSPPPTNTPPPSSPSGENHVSQSPLRHLIPLLLGAVVFIVLGALAFMLIPKFINKSSGPVTLTYWGLWEPASVMQTVIADYERENPGVKIDYSMQSSKNYRSRLQSAISSGKPPDIARIHNTWLPMLGKNLSPKPDSVAIDVNSYYPVVKEDLVVSGRLYAVPLEIDGLALYYNEDILKEAGAQAPSDWNELRKLAYDLTEFKPGSGVIERAGMAMGTATNVDHWSDILGLLILQNGGDPGDPSSSAVQDALTFYTLFSTSDKSWDSAQPSSTYAFATGTVAMMLAPSWHTSEIKAINPNLNYRIARAPSLPNVTTAWATYWAEAVPLNSQNQEAAWRFLAYLQKPEVLQKLYSAESQLRPIGEPYPHVSQAALLQQDSLASAFVSQGADYTSWYLAAKTGDEGINDEFMQYYEDAITALNNGSTIGSIQKALVEGIAQVKSKYPQAK